VLPTDQFPPISAGTFRDPQGRLFDDGDRILREIFPGHTEQVLQWIRSPLAQSWMQSGRLISTEVAPLEADRPLLLEHERIFFPTYPWEWTPGQWLAAGNLTLDLCDEALDADYILKDATPLNILFSDARPVFVDVLSFERRDPNNPLWIAYAQFARTFLLPLAANAYLGWPLSASQQRRDGYEPADLSPWLNFTQRWLSPLRSIVTLPLLLQGRHVDRQTAPGTRKRDVSEDIAKAIVRRTVRSAKTKLRALAPPQRSSRWSDYTQTASHYESEAQLAKQEFVRRVLSEIKPAHVLDVGANTGVFSRIAAASGAHVVAWDSDVEAIDRNWQQSFEDNLAILPLVADFARPTPAVGWCNSECASLLDRAQGRFDCVLMLGILHHLLMSDQIPLSAVLNQLAEFTTHWAVLEWIPSEDSQFISLCRGRELLYSHLNESYFVQILAERFSIRSREPLSNGRTLWFVEKKA